MSRYFMQGTRLAWAERMMMDPSRSPTDHNDTQSPRQKRPCDKSAKPIHSGQKMPEDSVWGLNNHTDFQTMCPEDFPILSDLYNVIEDAYQHYEREENPLYPQELLQEVLLGLHSMCKGAESKFFNGHTNITSSRWMSGCTTRCPASWAVKP